MNFISKGKNLFISKGKNLFIWFFIFTSPIFITALYLSRNFPQNQFRIFSLVALFYLLIAFWHHQKDKTLSWEIYLEYVLLAALAFVFLQKSFI